ncbi:penicillin-binding protein 1A [Hyphobacterium marinum]|uniref:Penicillin-binding protein 1A n=1 Tax=Hyphobacterium marinum TaxID=3116574 RepID=A0ABU7M0B7_9PROT|nr:penicillin-binding protein 1A [Hyphobacterium sp. Y6023]MEE2567259.1 penicillin-binding protein 1A [Hyphobacterium sp. Y6023]
MKLLSWRNFFRVVLWGGAVAIVLGIGVLIAAAVYVVRVTEDLPDYEQLANYEPSIMSRVHAGDGRLIAEYAREHRVFVAIENIPPTVINAFLAAEDKDFYEHGGLDFRGIVRAAFANIGHVLRDENLEGASTITQQVAKNFLLTSEQRFDRKVQEMVLARRIERAFTKDEILELYLNEIYFGRRSYGIAAAALNYFGKSVDELTLAETAYLAAVVNGPALFHPERHPEAAVNRRNWVLGRMIANGFVSEEDGRAAMEEPLEVNERLSGEQYLAAEYFVEEVRRQVFDVYGEDQLYEGGLSIRTTLDTRLQLAARSALRSGLEEYDRRHGYRGPLGQIETGDGWQERLDAFEPPRDLDEGWLVAVVLAAGAENARIGYLAPEVLEDEIDAESGEVIEAEMVPGEGIIPLSELAWAREALREGEMGPRIDRASQVLSAGDVILVEALAGEDASPNTFGLRQVPAVNGGILAMDPHTGRVLAMVGGYSFQQSQFNRATQARRQPGSSFKPFVYAAAMDNGYTPVSMVLDAPFVADSGNEEDGFYRPQNYSERFYGMSTLRLGLVLSRNVMTVRLAQEMGMDPIVEYGERFGIYDDLDPVLAMALGAGETTLWRLVAAYGALVNGGVRVDPTILDRVQDRNGATIYVHDQRLCAVCDVPEWTPGMNEPELPELGEEVVSPVTAYQIVHILEEAVQSGTGTALRPLGRPLAGKTGTTNDFHDAWFVGFGPDIVVGAYVGFDSPQPMGAGEAGGRVAAPIVRDFLEVALENYPVAPFRVPEGVRLVPVDSRTGEPSVLGRPGVILEAFHPGTEPSRTAGGSESSLSFGNTSVSGSEPDEDGEGEGEDEEEEDLGGLY